MSILKPRNCLKHVFAYHADDGDVTLNPGTIYIIDKILEMDIKTVSLDIVKEANYVLDSLCEGNINEAERFLKNKNAIYDHILTAFGAENTSESVDKVESYAHQYVGFYDTCFADTDDEVKRYASAIALDMKRESFNQFVL